MAIFFDIDETLIDQRRAEAAGAGHFLAAFGHLLPRAYTVAEFCRLWRRLREKHAPAFLHGTLSCQEQRRRRIRELFREQEAFLPDREADRRFAVYAEHYRAAWGLFEDVLPCLDALSGQTLGVISNGSAEQQRRKLSQTGILDRFDVVTISEEAGTAKPQVEIFLAACRRAGCWAGEGVHIGDRLDLDVRGSCTAGLRGIWLTRRRQPRRAAVETIRSLTELEAKLRQEEATGREASR